MAAIEYRGLNAVTNFDLSRYIKWLKPNNNTTTTKSNPNPNPNVDTHNIATSSNHNDSVSSPTLPPLQQLPDTTTNTAALIQPRPTTATSALGLLLQSSKFKELMEMTLAAECPSTTLDEYGHMNTTQSSIPDDIKTYFESNDFRTYNVDQGDDIFGDFSSFMEPMIQFDSSVLNGEDLDL